MTINDTTTKNGVLSAISTGVGAGGKIRVYAGATVLAELTGLTFGSPSGGSMTFTATADSSNDASGTPDGVKLLNSANTVIATFAGGEFTVGAIVLAGTTTLTSGSLAA